MEVRVCLFSFNARASRFYNNNCLKNYKKTFKIVPIRSLFGTYFKVYACAQIE